MIEIEPVQIGMPCVDITKIGMSGIGSRGQGLVVSIDGYKWDDGKYVLFDDSSVAKY